MTEDAACICDGIADIDPTFIRRVKEKLHCAARAGRTAEAGISQRNHRRGQHIVAPVRVPNSHGVAIDGILTNGIESCRCDLDTGVGVIGNDIILDEGVLNAIQNDAA